MKKIMHRNKFIMGMALFLSYFIMFFGYSSPIKIQKNGGGFIECEYTLLSFNDGQTPELSIVTNSSGVVCDVTGGTDPGTGGGDNLPTPTHPLGLVADSSGSPTNKPAFYRWKKVAGATFYQLRVFTGPGAYADNRRIYSVNLKSDGNAGQIARYNAACGNSTEYCVLGSAVNYYNVTANGGVALTGTTLNNGQYQWQVRVAAGDTTTDWSDGTANFNIGLVQVSDTASESPAQFLAAWTSQLYNPVTYANNFTTKAQLRTLLNTAPYNSYQEIAGNKKVYIVNKGANTATIIPSCVNGKNGSLSGRNCNINIPFKLNDIFSLRLKTRNNGSNGSINKSSNQLYTYQGALYKVVVSKYPGRMVANQSDDFQGRCGVTTYNRIGEFYLGTSPHSYSSTSHCIVPAGTQFYTNIEIVEGETQCETGLCQIDVTPNGYENP